MAVDGPFAVYGDDPEQSGAADSKDSKGEHDGGPRDLGRPANVRHAETRSRAEYYEALRAPDGWTAAANKADLASSGTITRSAWDSPDTVRVPPERVTHILDGDRWGGGHRHGTRRPGKTEFPASWDDEKIIGHILDVARAPDGPRVFQANRRWRVHGLGDDVGITVIVNPTAESGLRGQIPAAQESSRTRRRHNSERIRSHRA